MTRWPPSEVTPSADCVSCPHTFPSERLLHPITLSPHPISSFRSCTHPQRRQLPGENRRALGSLWIKKPGLGMTISVWTLLFLLKVSRVSAKTSATHNPKGYSGRAMSQDNRKTLTCIFRFRFPVFSTFWFLSQWVTYHANHRL